MLTGSLSYTQVELLSVSGNTALTHSVNSSVFKALQSQHLRPYMWLGSESVSNVAHLSLNMETPHQGWLTFS